jgi:O-antigen/teichoic acid export membrane protein
MEGAKNRVIGRNILANVFGGSWSLFLSLLIVPLKMRILGVDAFGLLAFIASLQVILGIFDLGLSPTIAREVAIDTSPNLLHSRDLLQTLSAVYGGIGLLLGATLFLGADWLIDHWLKLGTLPVEAARSSLRLGALAIMLSWPVSFYTGVITGRERFDILNAVRTASSTVLQLGSAAVLLVFGNLVAFAAWLAVSSLVEVTLYLVACFRLVPGLSLWPRVSRKAIAQVWHFAMSMSVVRVLAIALTQSDRLLLSRLAPIETLGYYSLALSVLRGLPLVQRFVTSALFPSFAANYVRDAMDKLVSDYNRATQGLVYVCTLPVAAFIFFGEDILRIWISTGTAAPSALILKVLAPGFLLAASVSISSTLAVATGNTGIVIRRNLIGTVLYLPLLYFAITRWGGVGAAAASTVVNLAILFTVLPLVQTRIIGQTTKRWLELNLLPFVAVGIVSFGAARFALVITGWYGDIAVVVICAVATVVYGLWGLRLLYPDVRRMLLPFFGRVISVRRGVDQTEKRVLGRSG